MLSVVVCHITLGTLSVTRHLSMYNVFDHYRTSFYYLNSQENCVNFPE